MKKISLESVNITCPFKILCLDKVKVLSLMFETAQFDSFVTMRFTLIMSEFSSKR